VAEAAVDTRVNVWCLPLLRQRDGGRAGKSAVGAPDDAALERMAAVLSPEERAIAAAFDAPDRRRSYIAAHALLRSILGRTIGVAPNELVFRYGHRGKPELVGPATHNVQFNMSHSRDVVLVAVAHGRRVGVDIEHIDEPGDVRRIAARFLSPRDRDAIEQLPLDRQREGFLRCWTRKEAYMKARGDGISRPLDDFDVALSGDCTSATPRLTATSGDPNEADRWELADISAPRGFMAAIAVEGHGFEVVQHVDWTDDD
jgi:4'-phosphopantetheinyl transferase